MLYVATDTASRAFESEPRPLTPLVRPLAADQPCTFNHPIIRSLESEPSLETVLAPPFQMMKEQHQHLQKARRGRGRLSGKAGSGPARSSWLGRRPRVKQPCDPA